MPLYKYRAALEDGRKKTGYIESQSPQALYQVLNSKNEYLVSYQSVGENIDIHSTILKKLYFSFLYAVLAPYGRNRLNYLIFLCQKLIQLDRASFPLVQIFNILAMSETNPFWQNLLFEIRTRLLQGEKLSCIFTHYPKVFDPLWPQLAQAGEQSGAYHYVFEELLNYLVWKKELDHDLKKALIYPCVLLSLMMTMVIAAANYLIPEIQSLFQSFGQTPLPLSTRMLLKTSHFLQNYGSIFFISLAAFIGLFYGLSKTFIQVRIKWNKFILILPWIGHFQKDMDLLRFLDTLGFLLKSGIHLMEALESAARNLSNVYMAREFQTIGWSIQQGVSLSNACANTNFFSSFWISLIELGEKTGDLGNLLRKNTYQEKKILLEQINNSIQLLHPLLITFGGLMLMWIVFGTVLPVYEHMEEFLY